jgi:hypothetical protein
MWNDRSIRQLAPILGDEGEAQRPRPGPRLCNQRYRRLCRWTATRVKGGPDRSKGQRAVLWSLATAPLALAFAVWLPVSFLAMLLDAVVDRVRRGKYNDMAFARGINRYERAQLSSPRRRTYGGD